MRKILIVSMFFAVLGVTTVAMATLPARSADWQFDKEAEVPVPDKSGNGYDLAHDSGTYTWVDNTWQTYTTKAIKFPTDSATNDGLKCVSGFLGNVAPASPPSTFSISIALTIKPDTIPSGHEGNYWVVQKMNYCDKLNHTTGTLGVGWGVYVNLTNRRAYFCFYEKDGKYKEARSDDQIDANEWWFLAITHDYNISSAGSGYTHWYINDGTGMIHDGYLHEYDQMKTSAAEQVSVGWPRGGTSRTIRGYCGVVDDVKIWENVLLTAAQVTEAYNMAKLGKKYPVADFNHNYYVDSQDFLIFGFCATGPAIPYYPNLPANCTLTPDGEHKIAADLDRDGDVDQDDFAVFQRCYNGSSQEADPNCM